MGFMLDDDERSRILATDSESAACIFSCLSAEDFNSSPTQSASRFVIYFGDLSEKEASEYRGAWSHILRTVKDARQKYENTSLSKYWWRFKRPTKDLYEAIWREDRVLVCPVVTKYLSFAWIRSKTILLNRVYAFVGATDTDFMVLQSGLYNAWAWNWSGRLKGDMQYAPTDCFDNFPFPLSSPSVLSIAAIAIEYSQHRAAIMLSRSDGLTSTYNRFHDPSNTSGDIQKLRDLHVEMDNAVAAAYGWDDLDLGHGFHETKQGLRFTISETARREVLSRLLKLNHARYAEEVARGLHDKKRGIENAKRATNAHPRLFD